MVKAVSLVVELFAGFLLFVCLKTFNSSRAESNQEVTKRVMEAIVADHMGTEKCPWSAAEMKGAAATYLKSLHDASMRAKKGKREAHKNLCRKQGRVRDKIQRRLQTLKTMPWSEEKKALVEQAVGSSQYTSSDESDFSDDENGQPKLSGYLVKKLPWERSALTKVKKALDDAHIKSLNVRARVNMVARRLHPMPSTKPRPIDGLEWEMRSEEPATATSRTFSPPTPAISSHSTPSSTRNSFHSIRTPTPATPPDSVQPSTTGSSSRSIPTAAHATLSDSTRLSTAAISSRSILTLAGSARPSTTGSSSRSIHPQTTTTPSHSSRLLGTGSSSDSSAKRKKVPKTKKDTVRRPLKRAVTSPEY